MILCWSEYGLNYLAQLCSFSTSFLICKWFSFTNALNLVYTNQLHICHLRVALSPLICCWRHSTCSSSSKSQNWSLSRHYTLKGEGTSYFPTRNVTTRRQGHIFSFDLNVLFSSNCARKQWLDQDFIILNDCIFIKQTKAYSVPNWLAYFGKIQRFHLQSTSLNITSLNRTFS